MRRGRGKMGGASPVASMAALALLAGACGLDIVGTNDGTFDGGALPGDATSEGAAPTADATTDAADDASDDVGIDAPADAPRDTATDTTPFDACPVGGCPPPATCKQIYDATPPPVTSGLYTVDPDGAGPKAPFQVWCDMTTDGGGWTLVGREISGGMGTFRFLDVDTNNVTAIATGGQSGL